MSKDYIYCPSCSEKLVEKEIDNEKVKTCPKCGFIYWNNPKPVVSMVIQKDEKVLMLKRSNEPFKNFWVLPGGFIGISDTPQQAIQKEVKEETNLVTRIEGIVGVYRIDDDPRRIHIDIIFYGTGSETIYLSAEDSDWEYFSPKELPDKIAYKHRDAITDWYNVNRK